MRQLSREWKLCGKTIALVPTMGFLHEGHLSLVRIARGKADLVVASIFVNPVQFGAGEDFESYPRNMERDLDLLEKERVDVVFAPEPGEMYPCGYSTYVNVEGLTDVLCGKTRPGHYRGVTTVVAKLFNLVMPDLAVFGEKDYQQAIVVRRMVEDLNMGVEIVLGATVREANGLAMSSRNSYLTKKEREDASVIRRSLLEAEKMVREGERNARKVSEAVKRIMGRKDSLDIEYVSVVDPETLREIERIDGAAVVAVAVRIGRARLIDNIRIGERSSRSC